MRRKTKKSKSRPWRCWPRRVFLLALLTLTLTTASIPSEQAFDLRLAPFIETQRFDWVGWETHAVLEEIGWWLHGYLTPDSQDSPTNLVEGGDEVRAFLARQQSIAELENQIREALARLPQSSPVAPFEGAPILPPSLTPLERELEALRRQQEAAAPRVERIMAAQVAQVLVDEGLGTGQAWPPVTFRFNDLPTYLVISPRDEIRNYRGVYMIPDIPETDRASLEASIEKALDVSALVVNVGGIGSWPTMVTDNASLHSLIDIVAHEWTHTYVLLRPLGLHYSDSRDLTTMNETVASIVGGEVADLVISRYYPELAPPPVTQPKPPVEEGSSTREDFNQAMRRIRLHVDELLADGRVGEAEAYMEAERQKLIAQGYDLRRLNQAYFAFYGSYATSPASVDPIGPWLRQLRAQSGSLKDFLDQVAQMRSLDDLLRALEEKRVSHTACCVVRNTRPPQVRSTQYAIRSTFH
jgi:hypothetical protein